MWHRSRIPSPTTPRCPGSAPCAAASVIRFYATGGYAHGKVKTKITTDIGLGPVAADISNTRSGWTVGGGVEPPLTFPAGVLGNNWTLKTEYLYVDLGNSTGAYTVLGAAAPTAVSNGTQVHKHIFRTALNRHFNSPVVAKY